MSRTTAKPNAATPTPIPALVPLDSPVSAVVVLGAVAVEVASGSVMVVGWPSLAVDVTVVLPLAFGV